MVSLLRVSRVSVTQRRGGLFTSSELVILLLLSTAVGTGKSIELLELLWRVAVEMWLWTGCSEYHGG